MAWLPWLLILLAVIDWVLLRNGTVTHPPWVLATLVAAAMALLLLRLVVGVRELVTSTGSRLGAVGRMIVLLGALVTLGAGSTNWLLRLDGFVILEEGELVTLHRGAHLQHFEAGPLARLEEMDVTVRLEELELLPAAGGYFYPESRLAIGLGAGNATRLGLQPRRGGAVGELRFFQGAFGFAPRIVILRSGEAVFDEVVPFTTERREASGISFSGEFSLASESLTVEGSVDLTSLDEGMRGHATLNLLVRREGEVIGRGSLLPGHFAEIDEGYRVGFAGLEKWSEIDISRRHQGRLVLAGLGMAVVGGLVWGVAAWRGW